jgi:hypothetical protein
LKQLQEIVGNTLEYIGIGNDFLNRATRALQQRERMNKWDCIKLKSSEQQKKVTRLKRLPMEWEKTFAIYSSDKGLIPRIYGNSKNSAPKNQHPNEEMGS